MPRRHRKRHSQTKPARSQFRHIQRRWRLWVEASGFARNPTPACFIKVDAVGERRFRSNPSLGFSSATARNRKKLLLTLAANVNSRSSDRNVLFSIAVLITSSRRSSLRKRYSVTPSQIRNSCFLLTRHRGRGETFTNRRGTNHVVVRDDTELPPAINDSQQTKMVVGRPLLRRLREGEPIQHLVL
jgi:hypothetical protein